MRGEDRTVRGGGWMTRGRATGVGPCRPHNRVVDLSATLNYLGLGRAQMDHGVPRFKHSLAGEV